jgi:hypothetical protein
MLVINAQQLFDLVRFHPAGQVWRIGRQQLAERVNQTVTVSPGH